VVELEEVEVVVVDDDVDDEVVGATSFSGNTDCTEVVPSATRKTALYEPAAA
jgi:hypothetical protein